ncbi:Ubiquitin-like domain-containing protein [Entamoeba marina]
MSRDIIDLDSSSEEDCVMTGKPSFTEDHSYQNTKVIDTKPKPTESINITIVRDEISKNMVVSSADTTLQVKKRYYDGNPSGITFKFMGLVMKDDQNLQHYTISNGSKIICTIDEDLFDKADCVKLKLRYDNNSKSFKILPLKKFENLFKKYAEIIGVDVANLRFFFDGYLLKNTDTAYDLEMENGFIVDVMKC